jgi:hypothetical protein
MRADLARQPQRRVTDVSSDNPRSRVAAAICTACILAIECHRIGIPSASVCSDEVKIGMTHATMSHTSDVAQ